MKLNKPIITIIVIILLVLDLIFFSFTLICRTIVKKDNIEKMVDNFDLKAYVLSNDRIKESIDNYKYPKEVFDYIDQFNLLNIKRAFLKSLYNGEEILIDKENISYLLKSSVYEYENITHEYSYEYVVNDIEYFSSDISYYFNNDFINVYNLFNVLSSETLSYILLLVSMILSLILIIVEKNTGFLICSIIFLITSFVLFYLDINLYTVIPFMDKYIDNLKITLDNRYLICFIFGFVLLLIYIVYFIKKQMREFRLRNWR